MGLPLTTAYVNLDNIRSNFKYVKSKLSESTFVMAIVKSDAYGHGVKRVAAELVECGADWFGVARLVEAVELRRCGITKPILILGYTDPALAEQLYTEQLTQTVFSTEYARQLDGFSREAGVTVNCHIKVDTGMTRLGFRGESPALIAKEIMGVMDCSNLSFTGIFTHFAVADEDTAESRDFTLMQGRLFADTVDELKKEGHSFKLVHACNSAGTLCYPQFHFDMVRPGIVLYGYSPFGGFCSGLKPAMELKTMVESVKTVKRGTSVSYGRDYITEEETTICALGAGYADGIHRSLSGKGMVWINGSLATMVGRICMDQLMVEATGIEVSIGDEAVIFGGDSPITAESVGGLCGTNSYECLCAISRRVPRVYTKEGVVVATAEYYKR